MIALAARYWYVLVIAALMVPLGVQQVSVSNARQQAAETRAALASDRATYAQAAQAAETAQRAEESRRAESTRKTIEDAHAQLQTAQDDAARAAGAADGLRRRVAAYVAASRAAGNNPGASGRGPSVEGGDAIGLLADVLSRSDARSGELAAYADRLRVAGAACERWAGGLQLTVQR